MELFNAVHVSNDIFVLAEYIRQLNLNIKHKTLCEVIGYARTICSGLPHEEELFKHFKKDATFVNKDKGLLGKIIEYALFGQKPNSSSKSDLLCGFDIKSCAFKDLKNNRKNAK